MTKVMTVVGARLEIIRLPQGMKRVGTTADFVLGSEAETDTPDYASALRGIAEEL